MKSKLFIWILMLALLAACGPAPQSSEPEAEEETAETAVVEEPAEEAVAEEPAPETQVEVEEVEEPAAVPEEPELVPFDIPENLDDLVITELEAGDGPTPEEGDYVQFHFVGHLADGTPIADTYEIGEPIVLPLGENAVMPAWDMALAQMQVGDKVNIIVPPELGFGAQGAGAIIPPNAVLVFDLELVSIPEIEFEEVEAGTGDTPESGDFVSVHYTGTLEDGTEFDSSYERDQPLTFELNGQDVIPGWHLGVGQMQEGGKAILTIPPSLAYGSQGAGGVIPPDATLTFEVELVEIITIEFEEVEAGTGDQAEPGDLVRVHYTGTLEDGTVFDSSVERGEPIEFVLGQGRVIPGWDIGIAMMREGGQAILTIPPALGYGAQGSGTIPPNSTLTFEVELVEIVDQ